MGTQESGFCKSAIELHIIIRYNTIRSSVVVQNDSVSHIGGEKKLSRSAGIPFTLAK